MPDELGMYAHARGFIEAKPNEHLMAELTKLVREEKLTAFVVGLPLEMGGAEGQACRKVRKLAQAIADHVGVEIELWDERLTTTEAHRELAASGHRARERRSRVDTVAAVKILEAWMARERGEIGEL